MGFKIVIAEKAQSDYENQIVYLRENTTDKHAIEVGRVVKEKIETLRQEPFLYQVMDDPKYATLGVRRIPVVGMYVYYGVSDEKRQINIYRIRSQKQENKNIDL